MREIKFRAWDRDHGEMVYQSPTVDAAKILSRYDVVMQFTGLHDANGVEIYEGDIVSGKSYLYGYDLDGDEQFYYFGVVEWQAQADVGLCYSVRHPDGSVWDLRKCVHRVCIDHMTGEVIGNIHENPHFIPAGKE